MPYELADVVIEKGYYERDYTGKVGWMGHYAFTTGYNELEGVFIYQETYPLEGKTGKNWTVTFDKFSEGWRGFLGAHNPFRKQT